METINGIISDETTQKGAEGGIISTRVVKTFIPVENKQAELDAIAQQRADLDAREQKVQDELSLAQPVKTTP